MANLESAQSLSAERCQNQNQGQINEAFCPGPLNGVGVHAIYLPAPSKGCHPFEGAGTSQQTPKIIQFTSHLDRPFWVRGPTTILRGRKRSPCLLITLRMIGPSKAWRHFEDLNTPASYRFIHPSIGGFKIPMAVVYVHRPAPLCIWVWLNFDDISPTWMTIGSHNPGKIAQLH